MDASITHQKWRFNSIISVKSEIWHLPPAVSAAPWATSLCPHGWYMILSRMCRMKCFCFQKYQRLILLIQQLLVPNKLISMTSVIPESNVHASSRVSLSKSRKFSLLATIKGNRVFPSGWAVTVYRLDLTVTTGSATYRKETLAWNKQHKWGSKQDSQSPDTRMSLLNPPAVSWWNLQMLI